MFFQRNVDILLGFKCGSFKLLSNSIDLHDPVTRELSFYTVFYNSLIT